MNSSAVLRLNRRLLIGGIDLVCLGFRANFAPWCGLVSLVSLGPEDVNDSWKRFSTGCLRRAWPFVRFAIFLCVVMALYMFKNYLQCDRFVIIAPNVASLYEFNHGVAPRLQSLVAMASGSDNFSYAVLRQNPIRLATGVITTLGWLMAVASLFSTKALVPRPLTVFALVGGLMHSLRYNILAGYGVRWAIPLLPIWCLSVVFACVFLWRRLRLATDHDRAGTRQEEFSTAGARYKFAATDT